MEKSKSNKVYIYAYALSFILVLSLFTIFIYNKNNTTKIAQEKETIQANKLINSWKFKDTIDNLNKDWTWELTRQKKLKLLSAYLNYWNYFYKEEESSKNAIEILNTMEDDYSKFYYYWYAKEIIKDYTGALDNYNKWLQIKDLTDERKSLFLNQVWHVYDLKGEFDKVFSYYDEAYKLDPNNASALANLWRYYSRVWEYQKWYEFLNKSLGLTVNLPQKSEICFWLSSLELELNWLKPDIEKSIDYARKSIEYYPEYAMWYVALARWLYMKNDKRYYKEIEESLNKSIELNPNGYYAYELYAFHEYDKKDYDKSLEMFKKADWAIDNDMILMDNVRESEKMTVNFKYYILFEIKKNKANKVKIFDFIDKMTVTNLWKSIIKQQLKRNWYGILWVYQNDAKFTELLIKIK